MAIIGTLQKSHHIYNISMHKSIGKVHKPGCYTVDSTVRFCFLYFSSLLRYYLYFLIYNVSFGIEPSSGHSNPNLKHWTSQTPTKYPVVFDGHLLCNQKEVMGRLQGLDISVCSLKRGFLQDGSVYLCECGSIGCGTVLWDWTSAYSACPLWKSARLLALSPSYWAFSHHKLACMNTSFFCSILKFPQTSQHLSNSGNRKSLFSFLFWSFRLDRYRKSICIPTLCYYTRRLCQIQFGRVTVEAL